MPISIEHAYPKIGIKTTPARLEIQTQEARLSMEQKQAKVLIDIEPVKVLIDQYDCRASSGMKNMKDLTASINQIAKQKCMEYIDKKVGEGKELRAIENGGNAVKNIAVRNATTTHEFGMVTMPSSPPKFQVEGSVKIDWERNWEGTSSGVEYDYQAGKIDISSVAGKVEIYMQQEAMLKISYQPESKIDVKL